MAISKKYLCILSIMMLSSCYYDVEEEIYGIDECDTMEMSYSNDIVPILSAHCYQCHDTNGNQGGVTLEGYESLKNFVDSGQILGAIKRESGYSPMPKDLPMLQDCKIDKIESWINDGALNN